MICPKCGRPVEENAVICRGCDFILDTGFLGDGILDEEHQLRPGAGGVDPGAFNLADAVILGNIDDESQSFETSDSGFHMAAHMHARLYVSGRSQALMSPDAVPALSSNSFEAVRLTPFERHVLGFIDGKKPVEVIRRAAGLDEAEVKTALATLADKGVVKVVGRALADFDPGVETAQRRAPPRHRMRGSVVGAVALVGDEADKAIEEAFRTQVALNPIKPAMLKAGVADGDVFVAAGKRDTGPNKKVEHLGDSDLPSDFDQFVGLKGTDEIDKKKLQPAAAAGDASTSTVRPSAQKAAFNRAGSGKLGTMARPAASEDLDSQDGIDASAEESAVERSIAERSDGFDDFGQPSDVSTAVVAQASSSDSSNVSTGPASPVRLPPPRAKSGVFADVSDSGGAVLSSVAGLADSRVQERPKLAPAAAPPPQLASGSGSGLDESPSVEIERIAASGDVWDEKPGDKPRPSTGIKQTVSSSLSDLLSDKEEEPTRNIPPDRAAAIAAAGKRAAAAEAEDSESMEEPTAAGQPMPPLALPRVGRPPTAAPAVAAKAAPAAAKAAPVAESTSARMKNRGRSAMVSMPDGGGGGDEDGPVDETSGLHGVEAPKKRTGAADEIFDDVSGESGFQKPTSPEKQRAPKVSNAEPRSIRSIEVQSVSGDETAPPSQEPPEVEESAPDESVPSDSNSSESGSVEMVDSGLVIRPAAKANPLARPAMRARGSKPRPMASQESVSDPKAGGLMPEPSLEEDSLHAAMPNEDSENTVNVDPDERKRRLQPGGSGRPAVVAGGRAGAVAAIPSGFSQVVAAPEGPSGSRPRPTDENRRKARHLYEESQKDAAAGRLAAARMNIKLATIYDPDNNTYRAQLEAWERPATAPKPTAAPTSASSQASKLSDESQAEIKALYDEAQGYEDSGDVDQALEILEGGVERFPGAAAFHNRIGVILALRKRDYEGAVQAIQRAIDIDPENLHYKSNLGKIVSKMRARSD